MGAEAQQIQYDHEPTLISLQSLMRQPLEIVAKNHLLRYHLTLFAEGKTHPPEIYKFLTKYDIPWDEERIADLENRYNNGEQFILESPLHTHETKRLLHDIYIFENIIPQTSLPQTAQSTFLKPLLIAMRPHQWSKNLLLFLPALFHIHDLQINKLLHTVLCFIAMSLCASGVYLLNDWMDLYDDRKHPEKKKRPIASGTLNPFIGLLASPCMIVAGLLIALTTSTQNFSLLLFYIVTTSAYTFSLKRIPVVDVTTLTGLYLLRIALGSQTLMMEVVTLGWLAAGCGFYSLAFSKRYTELQSSQGSARKRGYTLEDHTWISLFGIGMCLFSIHFLVTLIMQQPTWNSTWAWFATFTLWQWYARIWVLTTRQHMPHDPVAFTIKDPISLGLAISSTLSIIAHQIFF